MENVVHECYDHSYGRNVFVGYGDEGYEACMEFMKRNKSDDYEYFRTEEDGFGWNDKEKMLPAPIYKDTTGQYSDEECDEDNVVEIPVPDDLLWKWWFEWLEFDREQCPYDEPEGGWDKPTKADFYRWVWEESICDETTCLYDWLVTHNYNWKRLN